jgi:hypothetical protein
MPKIVLSKHALQRARLRKMELYAIEQLILHPDQKFSLGENKFKFHKNISNRHYQAVATYLSKEDKWLIISAWIKGEEDQLPFIWLLISAPFRLLWWLLLNFFQLLGQMLGQIVAKIARKN